MVLRLSIDPGHPPHGCSLAGMPEHEYTWQVSVFLREWIRHLCEPFEIMITRSQGETVSLEERGNRTGLWGADFCLHIHVNAFKEQQAHGAEGYYWPGNVIGREVTDAILRAMPPPLYKGRMGTAALDSPLSKDDDWIRNARAVMEHHSCPSSLIEIGYSTNEADLKAMLDPATQSAICAALVCGAMRLRQMKETTK